MSTDDDDDDIMPFERIAFVFTNAVRGISDDEEALACVASVLAITLHERHGIVIRERVLMDVAHSVLNSLAKLDRMDEKP